MTSTPVTADMETPLLKAAKILVDHGIRHLPIVDGDRLVGVVSKRNIDLLIACRVNLDQLSIADAMTDLPYTVGPDTVVSEVCAEMASEKYGSVVITDEGKVEGIFTTTDALQVLAEVFRALPAS